MHVTINGVLKARPPRPITQGRQIPPDSSQSRCEEHEPSWGPFLTRQRLQAPCHALLFHTEFRKSLCNIRAA